MKTAYIIRGIPGSGKTTLARKLAGDRICAADDYFTAPDGSYHYDRDQLQQAHEHCFQRWLDLLSGPSPIAVHNTFVREWEYRRYYNAAVAAGWEIEIITLDVDPEIAAARNVHGVPADVIRRMHDSIRRGK